MLDLINFCQEYPIKIVIPNSLCFTLQRTNDRIIMDDSIQTKLKENQLRRINACRMFLKIIHLSDTCQPNGVDINTYLLEGIPKHILIQRSIDRSKRSHPLQLGSYGIKCFEKRLVYKLIINYFLTLPLVNWSPHIPRDP